ncbi:MAG: hypothetical protein ABR598_07695 [Candidatus Dormibacteria bacterium]
MKITSNDTLTVVTLVDPALTGWQPFPEKSHRTILGSYTLPGGRVVHYPKAVEYVSVTPKVLRIVKSNEATAWAALEQLFAMQDQLLAVGVVWDEYRVTPADGNYFLEDITPDYGSDFSDDGDIDVRITFQPADELSNAPALTIQHGGVVVGSITGGNVDIEH